MLQILLSFFLLFFFAGEKITFAQEVVSRRERVIRAALYEQSRERQKALAEAFKKAGTALVIETPLEEKNLVRDPNKLQKHSYIFLSTQFDDNIFLRQEKTSDMITAIQPGLKLEWTKLNQHFVLDAYMGYKIYATHGKYNNQKGTIMLSNEQRIGDFHYLRLSNVLESSYLAPGEIGKTGDDFVDFLTNDSKIEWEGRVNRIGYKLGYERKLNKYLTSDYSERNDYTENIFTITQYLKFLPKTWFLLNYGYDFIRYKNSVAKDRGSDAHEIEIGVEEQLAPKLFGLFRMGYKDQNYNTGDGVQTLIFYGDMTHNLSERTQIRFHLSRRTEESTYASNNYSVDTMLGFSAYHRLRANPKFTIEFIPNLRFREYSATSTQSEWNDTVFTLYSNVFYSFRKWLSFGLEYRYQKMTSNKLDQDEYTSNVFGLRTKAVF